MKITYPTIALVAASLLSAAFGIPSVGDPVPDLTALDEAGKPFPLREKLAGKPAVIVFGCLT